MSTLNKRAVNSNSYAWVNNLKMTPAEREFAVKVVRNGETLADALIWARDAIRSLAGKVGGINAKPVHLKHRHSH